MSRRKSTPLCLAAVVILSLATDSCSNDSTEVNAGCNLLADCPLDQYCDVPAQRCLPEAALTNGAVGRFSCLVTNPGSESVGESEILARTDRDGDGVITVNERWTFPSVAQCSLSATGQLVVGLKAWGPTAALSLSTDATAALKDSAPLGPAPSALAPNSLTLWDFENTRAWGYAAAGKVMLRGSLRVGETIEGYLTTDLLPVVRYADQVAYGIPCTKGMVTCGANMDVRCVQTATSPLCLATCGCDRECSVGGAVCIGASAEKSGLCLRRCSKNTDCLAPLLCQSLNGEGVCL